MFELYSNLLETFIKKRLLYTDGRLKDMRSIKDRCYKKENQKPLTLIEMGTQSRGFFCWKRKRWKVSKELCSVLCNCCLLLKDSFPFDKSILKYTQYLHPEKRNSISSTSGISNKALHITKALENALEGVFQVSCAISKEQVCDIIRKELVNLYIQLTAVNQPSCYKLFLLIGHICKMKQHN